MSLASATAKFLLFIFNLLFLVTGLAVAVVALLLEKVFLEKKAFVGDDLLSAPMVIAIFGVAICIISLFGCCGVIKENRYYLLLFSGLLFVVFLIELAVSAYGYVNSDSLKSIILTNMEGTMKNYNHTGSEGITQSWNILQHDFHCCGVHNATDWSVYTKTLPHSCCDKLPLEETCTYAFTYKEGCYTVFANFLSNKSCQLATIAIGISMAQLLSVLVSFLISRHVNRYYEAV